MLTCVADLGEKPAVLQKFEYSDFPLPEIKLYVTVGEPTVFLLRSEY